MNIGRLDRRIVIEVATAPADSFGAPTEAWGRFAEVWASVNQMGSREYFSGGLQAEVDTVFKLRWLAGVTAAMRIVYDGVTYDIKHPKELGRREGLEITAKARVA